MPMLKANSVNIYYELHGPEDAPVLVLNNGITARADRRGTCVVVGAAGGVQHSRIGLSGQATVTIR